MINFKTYLEAKSYRFALAQTNDDAKKLTKQLRIKQLEKLPYISIDYETLERPKWDKEMDDRTKMAYLKAAITIDYKALAEEKYIKVKDAWLYRFLSHKQRMARKGHYDDLYKGL